MNKTIFRATLTLALTTSFLSRSESDLPLKLMSIYASDWHLVKDIFITQPRAQTDTLLKTAERSVALLLLLLVYQTLLMLFPTKYTEKTKHITQHTKSILNRLTLCLRPPGAP